VHSAVNLHNTLLSHLLRLPKPFFDTNPAGVLSVMRSDNNTLSDIFVGSLAACYHTLYYKGQNRGVYMVGTSCAFGTTAHGFHT
jgi:ABC-type multidrug transport system fused ATPase/permease subunit